MMRESSGRSCFVTCQITHCIISQGYVGVAYKFARIPLCGKPTGCNTILPTTCSCYVCLPVYILLGLASIWTVVSGISNLSYCQFVTVCVCVCVCVCACVCMCAHVHVRAHAHAHAKFQKKKHRDIHTSSTLFKIISSSSLFASMLFTPFVDQVFKQLLPLGFA